VWACWTKNESHPKRDAARFHHSVQVMVHNLKLTNCFWDFPVNIFYIIHHRQWKLHKAKLWETTVFCLAAQTVLKQSWKSTFLRIHAEDFFVFFVCFVFAVGLRILGLTKQAFSHLNQASSPFCSGFGDEVS
jgi:hypothetical protein